MRCKKIFSVSIAALLASFASFGYARKNEAMKQAKKSYLFVNENDFISNIFFSLLTLTNFKFQSQNRPKNHSSEFTLSEDFSMHNQATLQHGGGGINE